MCPASEAEQIQPMDSDTGSHELSAQTPGPSWPSLPWCRSRATTVAIIAYAGWVSVRPTLVRQWPRPPMSGGRSTPGYSAASMTRPLPDAVPARIAGRCETGPAHCSPFFSSAPDSAGSVGRLHR